MWPFRKRPALTSDQEVRLVEVLANAFGAALQRTLDAQANQINQQGAFLDRLNDMSAKKAAQVMGQRGGRRTQERKRERRLLESSARSCNVCAGKRILTGADIDFHRAHGGETEGDRERVNGNSNGLQSATMS